METAARDSGGEEAIRREGRGAVFGRRVAGADEAGAAAGWEWEWESEWGCGCSAGFGYGVGSEEEAGEKVWRTKVKDENVDWKRDREVYRIPARRNWEVQTDVRCARGS